MEQPFRKREPYFKLQCNEKTLTNHDGPRSEIYFLYKENFKAYKIIGPYDPPDPNIKYARASWMSPPPSCWKYTKEEAEYMVAKRIELLNSPYGIKYVKELQKRRRSVERLLECKEDLKRSLRAIDSVLKRIKKEDEKSDSGDENTEEDSSEEEGSEEDVRPKKRAKRAKSNEHAFV